MAKVVDEGRGISLKRLSWQLELQGAPPPWVNLRGSIRVAWNSCLAFHNTYMEVSSEILIVLHNHLYNGCWCAGDVCGSDFGLRLRGQKSLLTWLLAQSYGRCGEIGLESWKGVFSFQCKSTARKRQVIIYSLWHLNNVSSDFQKHLLTYWAAVCFLQVTISSCGRKLLTEFTEKCCCYKMLVV